MSKIQKLEGSCGTIRCLAEAAVKHMPSYFTLVHDSSNSPQGDRKFFTRIYALKIKGEFTGETVKFIYDYRTRFAWAEYSNVAVQALSHNERGHEINDDKLLQSLSKAEKV